MDIDLSICICGIPSRMIKAKTLIDKLESISKGYKVEILYYCDNLVKSIGEKRKALVSISSGKYICFIDDDDDVTLDFTKMIIKAIRKKPDIVTFNQLATLIYTPITAAELHIEESKTYKINFSIYNENEVLHEGTVKRQPFHMCPIRREIVLKCEFPKEKVYNEDWVYMIQALNMCKTEVHIDKILHLYQFDETLTATQ